MTTAILLVLLSFPIAANLDTGNINLPLALLLFGAQFAGPASWPVCYGWSPRP